MMHAIAKAQSSSDGEGQPIAAEVADDQRRIHADVGGDGAQGGALVAFGSEGGGAPPRGCRRGVWNTLPGRLVVTQKTYMSSAVDLWQVPAYGLSHRLLKKVIGC
jgi:hypothetical protein